MRYGEENYIFTFALVMLALVTVALFGLPFTTIDKTVIATDARVVWLSEKIVGLETEIERLELLQPKVVDYSSAIIVSVALAALGILYFGFSKDDLRKKNLEQSYQIERLIEGKEKLEDEVNLLTSKRRNR